MVWSEEYTYVNGLEVTEVYAGYEEKNAFFSVAGDIANPATCGVTKSVIAVDPVRSDVNQALSLLLYAHASGKRVDIQIYNESCFSSHRIMRRVKVVN